MLLDFLPVYDDKVETLKLVLSLALGWAALFILFRFVLLRKLSADFSNRCVSIIHAIVTFVFLFYRIPHNEIFSGYGLATTLIEAQSTTFSISYFLYDTFCTIYSDLEGRGKVDFATFGHHVATMMGLVYAVFGSVSGKETTAALLVTEASGPCMHNRSLLRELGLKDSLLFTINDLVFGLIFSYMRVFYGTRMAYETLICPAPLIVKLGGVGLITVSYVWLFAIGKKVLRTITGSGKGTKKGAKKE